MTREQQIAKWTAAGYSRVHAESLVGGETVEQMEADGPAKRITASFPGAFAAVTAAKPAAQPAAGKAAQVLLKAGQKIQIKQIDSSNLNRIAKPQPEITPGVVHWIYATVLQLLDNGAALVQVTHPGNIEEGAKKVITPGEYRTKSDVQKELYELPENPTIEAVKDLKRSLFVQVKLLT
jgi:hypothetical protein